MKRQILPALAVLGALLLIPGCTSSSPSSSGKSERKSGAGAAATWSSAPAAARTPTALQRTDPNILEDTETYLVERVPKKDVIRIDEKHFRYPISPLPMEYFKQDDEYFYVYTVKTIPDELALRKREKEAMEGRSPGVAAENPELERGAVAPLSDFDDLIPARVNADFRLEEMKDTGLPTQGLWRASFVIADMNGDGIPDIVAPPSRLGDGKPHVWLGDGRGRYKAWPLSFIEDGQLRPAFTVDYGGIAAGDIDGDGHMDLVTASHGAGIVALFGDGKGTFTVSRQGLEGRGISAQAVTLVDANGDGKLDIIASKDVVDPNTKEPVDLNQARLYVNKGNRTFEFRPDSLAGAAYSYSLSPWDFDGDGKVDVLTGSHYYAAQVMLWKNTGKEKFTPVAFNDIESYAFHFRTCPGTWGPKKQPAFAETYQKYTNTPQAKAVGINVYSADGDSWTKHPVWRKKNGNPYLYALGYGDLNGDGLPDIVFPDSDARRVRIFLQQPDGSFREVAERQEPPIDSAAQCVRILDVDGDGRPDIVIAKTTTATFPGDPGGWSIYLNKK